MYHLYLGELKEQRSEVSLLPQATADQPSTSGGSSGRWSGLVPLKVVNTGEKAAFVASVEREIVEFRKDGSTTEAESIELEEPHSTRLKTGFEIDPHTTFRYQTRVTFKGEDKFFVEQDTVVVRHTIIVEDNKGSYEVSQDTELELYGPSHVREEFGLE